MTWKTKEIDQLGISDGLASSLKSKLKITQCGPLAEAFGNGGLATIKAFGQGAYDVLVRELMTVSKGEFEAMLPKDVAKDPDIGNAVSENKSLDNPTSLKVHEPETVAEKPEGSKDRKKPIKGMAVENVGAAPIAAGEIAVVTGVKDEGTMTVKRASGGPVGGPYETEAAINTKYTALREAADKILKQRKKVQDMDEEYDAKKESAKNAKKAKEDQRDILVEMLGELVDDQKRLPGMSSLKEEKPPASESAAPAAAETKTDWRDESITVIMGKGIARGTLSKLIEAGINSMGDLQDAFHRNGVYTIEGLKRDKADLIREKAFEWFNANRPKEPSKPGTEIVLLTDILDEAGNVVLEAGAHVQMATFPQGGVGFVHNGVTTRLRPDQWDGIRKEKPKLIQIIKPVPGADSAADGMLPGVECEVIKWHGDTAIVRAPKSGREVHVAPSEFEAL